MDIENEEPGQLAGFQSWVQRLQESIEMMQQSLQKAVQEPKVVYNLSGATIQGSVIGGSITKNGAEYYSGTHAQKAPPHYTDEQIAHALANIVGKNKAIDSKQKWAGGHKGTVPLCGGHKGTVPLCDDRETRSLTLLIHITE